jgi:hypothetical protein
MSTEQQAVGIVRTRHTAGCIKPTAPHPRRPRRCPQDQRQLTEPLRGLVAEIALTGTIRYAAASGRTSPAWPRPFGFTEHLGHAVLQTHPTWPTASRRDPPDRPARLPRRPRSFQWPLVRPLLEYLLELQLRRFEESSGVEVRAPAQQRPGPAPARLCSWRNARLQAWLFFRRNTVRT